MTVSKRGKYYHYEFQYQGQRKRGTTGCTSKREALDFETKIKNDLRNEVLFGRLPDMTWGEAIDRYFKTVILPKNKPATARNYLSTYAQLREDLGPNTLIKTLSRERLIRYKDDLLAGKGRTYSLKPGTIQRRLNDISAILNCAHRDWGMLATVPKVPRLVFNDRRERYLSEAEEALILAATGAQHTYDLIVFYLDTGARKSEATNLRWSDVDLDAGDQGVVSFMKTKTDKPRGVPITTRVREMLSRRLQDRELGEDYVFTVAGKPIGDPKRAIEGAIKRAGIVKDGDEKVTIHTFRHTFASRLVKREVPLYEVSKLLGHGSLSTTERYAHLAPEGLGSAIAKLET